MNDSTSPATALIDGMRERFHKIAGFSKTDADLLSFLDGQRAYIEIGTHGDSTHGYVSYSRDRGWESYISRPGCLPTLCHDEAGSEFCPCTLREAIGYYIDAAMR